MNKDARKTRQAGDILAEVWKIKDENAAEYGYDIQAIAMAARKHQGDHPDRIVRLKTSATDTEANQH